MLENLNNSANLKRKDESTGTQQQVQLQNIQPNIPQHQQQTTLQLESPLPQPKKPRLVFTDLQRRTLQAIFKV